MKQFKVQLHTHTKSDPEDCLFHTDKKLIDIAAKHQYDVLAITCHNKIAHTKELEEYADKKHILLIPGIEKNVLGRHVLIINPREEITAVNNFNDLREYKHTHPESLIIAPHPFHPIPYSLKEHFEPNIDLFDAIEWSSFYTPSLNFNKKTLETAEKFKLPLVGTSDNHSLKYLNLTFSYVFAHEKSTPAIIEAIKKGHLKIKTEPMSFLNLFFMTARLTALEQIKKAYKHIAKNKKT